jgi:hypothetical protein
MTKHIAEVSASWQNGEVLDILSGMMTLTARTAVETIFSEVLPSAMLGAVLTDFNTILVSTVSTRACSSHHRWTSSSL